MIFRRTEAEEFKLSSCHSTVSSLSQFSDSSSQKTSGIGRDGLEGIWVVELDEEEGYVILPRYSAVRFEVDLRDKVSVAVFCVTDGQLAEVGHIMHVPAKDNAAEAEAILCDGQKLLLGHELAA